MSFSASWLALREGADHRSRHAGLLGKLEASLAAKFSGKQVVRVVDLGSGTGSNLRATALRLGNQQEWTLVDYDPALLEQAAKCLSEWADEARAVGDQLVLIKNGMTIGVKFRIADLDRELDEVLSVSPDIVTASALFDLISPKWMKRFAKALAATEARFYTVLTYDGRDDFAPSHATDHQIIKAFATHQKRDKGFGPAAGPRAASTLVRVLRDAGFEVDTADSPWVLGEQDHALVSPLLDGLAGAVRETGLVKAPDLAEWLAFRQKAAKEAGSYITTGHTDILARKP